MQTNKKNYETVLILAPSLSKVERKDVIEKFTQLLQKEGVKIIHTESWEAQNLAYSIKKYHTGLYEVIEFETSNPAQGIIHKLETACKRDERVLRFLTVRLDDYGVAYNVQKRMDESNDKDESSKKNITNNEKAA